MPIICPIPFRNLTKLEFDERDRIVMRCAYDSQNALGRLCDERVYEEALIYLFGGEGQASIRSPLTLDGIQLGTHRFCLHDTNTSFMVTAFSDAESQRSHVHRLLKFSGFNAIQWLNFHHSSVRFTTLTR